jgi:phospholipase C
MSIRPPTSRSGWASQRKMITALRHSKAWENSAYLLTYDEHGGFFDHVAPRQVAAYGLGVRVPRWIVSPFARRGVVRSRKPDHTSTLKADRAPLGPTDARVAKPPVRHGYPDRR